jgi:hypothetical protein
VHPAEDATVGSDVPEPTLYLFDGYNLLHASELDDPRELVDALASFVAVRGAHGVVVFDGVGENRILGPLDVRYAPHADTLLERLAAEHRGTERVCLVSSDAAVRGTAGQEVAKIGSAEFAAAMGPAGLEDATLGGTLGDRLDPETVARLERLRLGEARAKRPGREAVLAVLDQLDAARARADREAKAAVFTAEPGTTLWDAAWGRAVEWSDRRVTLAGDVAWVSAEGRVGPASYLATAVLRRRDGRWLLHTYHGSLQP